MGPSHSFSSIHFTDSQNGWICGGNNTDASIIRTSDGGLTWIAENPGTTDFLYGIYLTDSTHGWAVGFNGNIVSTISTTNTPPVKPSNPIPENGALNVYVNPTLSVLVSDPNSEPMTVRFYNASNDLLIGTDYNVVSGTRAYIIWNYLSDNTNYSWYAVADDGVDLNQSDTWIFSTGEIGYDPYTVEFLLNVGFNMIGWYHPYDTLVSNIAENITGCLSISGWDSINQTYKTYIVGGPPSFDFVISRGMGLFVDVSEQSYWYGEG
jgi:hypothetical protein